MAAQASPTIIIAFCVALHSNQCPPMQCKSQTSADLPHKLLLLHPVHQNFLLRGWLSLAVEEWLLAQAARP